MPSAETPAIFTLPLPIHHLPALMKPRTAAMLEADLADPDAARAGDLLGLSLTYHNSLSGTLNRGPYLTLIEGPDGPEFHALPDLSQEFREKISRTLIQLQCDATAEEGLKQIVGNMGEDEESYIDVWVFPNAMLLVDNHWENSQWDAAEDVELHCHTCLVLRAGPSAHECLANLPELERIVRLWNRCWGRPGSLSDNPLVHVCLPSASDLRD